MDPEIRIVAADAGAARPLRREILRPHQELSELVYPGEDHPDALHVVARDRAGPIVGAATVVPEGHPEDPSPGDWRLRGMATAPSVRGTGVGAALLGACVAHVAEHGGARLWCNARVEAEGFYVRAGFKTETDVWDEPFLGAHIRMALYVSSRP